MRKVTLLLGIAFALLPLKVNAQTIVVNPTKILITPPPEHTATDDRRVLNYVVKIYQSTVTGTTPPASAVPTYSIPAGRGIDVGPDVELSTFLTTVDTGLYKVCVSAVNKVGESPCSNFALELYLRAKEPKSPTNTRLGED